MRFIHLTLIILVLVFLGLSILPIKLPSISLPKGAQHNTIGELPFVEVMDDGDFYEIDGGEGGYGKCIESGFNKCNDILEKSSRIWTDAIESNCWNNVQESCSMSYRNELKKECIRPLIWYCDDMKSKAKSKCIVKIKSACEKTKTSFSDFKNL